MWPCTSLGVSDDVICYLSAACDNVRAMGVDWGSCLWRPRFYTQMPTKQLSSLNSVWFLVAFGEWQQRRWDWMYYWCHGDNYTTEQLPGFIFNINLNDIHMKIKDLVNLQERERKDTCLSDLCELKVYTLKVTDGHCPHPLTCQSSTPWKARGSPSSFFTSSCLFYSIFFPLVLLLSISCPQTRWGDG